MPTGYTAAIKDGITFEKFALDCARAFGACVSMREEPSDAAIPDVFEPSDYHLKKMAAAQERLSMLEQMTEAAANRSAHKEWDEAETRRAMAIAEKGALRAKYEAMLKKATEWVPPTPDHKGLSDFMIEQIKSSLDWDCDTSYYDKPTPRLSGAAWLTQAKEKEARDIEYHRKNYAEEVDRCASRTEWVRALRAAL